MKNALSKLGLILCLCLLSVLAIQADDDQGNVNDPNENPRANACYEGGSMEGQCDTGEEWEAGWFLIRFEYGLITRDQFPEIYAWALPDDVAGDGSVCYNGNGRSLLYNGNSGTLFNYTLYASEGCTGSTLPRSDLSSNHPIIVVASSSSAAGAKCVSIQSGGTPGIDWLSLYGFDAPHDVYVCIR